MADAVQNAMASEYKSITKGLILVATIVSWNILLDWLGHRYPWAGRLVHPPPLLLIRTAGSSARNMRSEMISQDELMSQLREQGVDDVAKVRSCHLEGDGQFSVVKNEPEGDDGSGKSQRTPRPDGAARLGFNARAAGRGVRGRGDTVGPRSTGRIGTPGRGPGPGHPARCRWSRPPRARSRPPSGCDGSGSAARPCVAMPCSEPRALCEGCGQPAPFITPEGEPYLEVHHLRRLSDGGPDHPAHVAALCPNCHRRCHHAGDARSFNSEVARRVRDRELRSAFRPHEARGGPRPLTRGREGVGKKIQPHHHAIHHLLQVSRLA